MKYRYKGKTGGNGILHSFLFSLFWSLQIFIDKLGMKYGGVKDPLVYNFQAFVLCGAIASIYFFFVKKGGFAKLEKRAVSDYAKLALLVSTAAILAITGLRLSSSINYGFIIKSSIVFVPVLAYFFLKERISKLEIWLVGIFLLGIYLLSTGGVAFVPGAGDILILAAAILYSVTSVFQKGFGKRYSADEITWVRNTLPIPIVFAIPAIFSGILSPFALEPPLFLLASSASSFLCVLFLSKALQETKATYVSMISMAVPVLNTLLGYLFLGESFTLISWLGAGTILGAGAVLVKSHSAK